MGWIIAAGVWGIVCGAIAWVAAMLKAKEPGDFIVWMGIGWGFAWTPTMLLAAGLWVSYQIQMWMTYWG